MNIPEVARGVTSYVEVALRLVLVGVLSVAGCADDAERMHEAPSAAQQTSGTPLVEVSASGTGCPAGTSSTSISSDGLAFTTTFSSYVTSVDSSSDTSTRDCQVEIKLRSPINRSYAVQALSYSGYALLGAGVTGRQVAGYAFAPGTPNLSSSDRRVDLVGPYDRSYAFSEEVQADRRTWSACGAEAKLNVATRVDLTNASPRGAGYMNLASPDGSAKLVVRLEARACDTNPPAPSPSSSSLVRVSRLNVQPSAILRNESFTVNWDMPVENKGALYRAQVRTPIDDGDALFWESPEIIGSSVRYDGPPLPLAGTYQVLVVTRLGSEQRASDRIPLIVRDSIGAALDKPTGVRVQPSPIQRAEPFLVSWTASANASQSTVYRVELRTVGGDGGRVIARSDESEATVAAFPASVAPSAGRYQLIVVARDSSRSVSSDALAVDVVDGQATKPNKSPLIGRYAARSQLLTGSASGSGSMMAMRELYIAEFAEVDGGIELRTRLCSQETSWVGFTLAMSTPETYPDIRRKVTVEGNSWTTDAQPFGTGYLREGVPECVGKAGRYVPKRPEQRWIRGTSCRCPTAIATLPTLDDCRVTDPDGDGQPGLAYNLVGSLARLDVTSHYVSVVRTHPVRGVIEPNGRHSSQVRLDELAVQLACQPASFCNVAESADGATPCVASANRMEFLPLPTPPSGQASWTCATLRASAGRLFTRAMPVVRECQRDQLTGP